MKCYVTVYYNGWQYIDTINVTFGYVVALTVFVHCEYIQQQIDSGKPFSEQCSYLFIVLSSQMSRASIEETVHD